MENPEKVIPWSEWMREYGVEEEKGQKVYALLDRNAGIIQEASAECVRLTMLENLKRVDADVDELDFDFIEIENGRLTTIG